MQSFSEADTGLGPTSLADTGCSGQVTTDYSLLLLLYSGEKPRLLISLWRLHGVKQGVRQETGAGLLGKAQSWLQWNPGPGRYLY